MSEKVVERLEDLHSKGYSLAIDNIPLNEDLVDKYNKHLHLFSYIKCIIQQSSEESRALIEFCKEYGLQTIAVKIERKEMFEEAKSLGCDFFEGYYFAQPKIIENAAYNPSRMAVLRLYNILMEDRSIDEAAKEFEKNPEIAVQLLQFINSAAFSFRQKISSIQQVIVLIGRIQLAKWLMLMIYSKSIASHLHTSPLMLMVKNRTELMERILEAIHPDATTAALSEAYMVGVLSLVETLFSIPLEEILKNINISDEVKDALLYDKGVYGDIYKLVRSVEHLEMDTIIEFEKKYKLNPNRVENIIINSIEEVAKMENPQEDEVS
jgi:EAL and modified HD-GYP domain-containing signal transduction protein